MRILITGASGMLGATLVSFLSENKAYEIFATGNSEFTHSFPNYKKFDLASESYEELISWANPDIIILSGALTNGNFCKTHPNDAFKINGISVDKFLNATDQRVKYIYISTDAVFPSKLHLAKESDHTYPENVYGKSKELGEFFLLSSERRFVIIRTTIVGLNLNIKKQGFVEWIISSSLNQEEIGLFEDVVFNPISIWDLAEEIAFLIQEDHICSEILHISGSDICTKYEFGLALLKDLQLDPSNVKKTKILNFKTRAKRCTDQTLDCSFYEEKYNRKLPGLLSTILSIKKHKN